MEGIHQQALKGKEKIFSLKYPDMLISVNNFGLVLWKQGKHKKAKTIHQQTLKKIENVLRLEHLDILINASNFGLVLECQSKYKKAEEIY